MLVRKILFAVCLGITILCGTQALKITAKAYLAEFLIEAAWQESLKTHSAIKPWSWADTWPVLSLEFSTGRKHYVLEGQNGQALAFGPAHLSESALPGHGREVIISAHRDTHFSDLKDVLIGDTLILQNIFSRKYKYRVVSARIVDTRDEMLLVDDTQESLRLITCYPFDAINPGGPLRYELTAVPENTQIESDFQNPNLHTAL